MTKITLSDLEATSVFLELKHPKTNEPLGVILEVLGPDSPPFRNLFNTFLERRIAKDDSEDSLADVTAHNDELLSTCVIGWSSDEFFGRRSPRRPCSPSSRTASCLVLSLNKSAFMNAPLTPSAAFSRSTSPRVVSSSQGTSASANIPLNSFVALPSAIIVSVR